MNLQLDWTAELIRWVLTEGTTSDDPKAFVASLGSRMAGSIPLHTFEISFPSLHPVHQVVTTIWRESGGAKVGHGSGGIVRLRAE